MRKTFAILTATAAAITFSCAATAQTSVVKPGQTLPKVDTSRIVVKPDVTITAPKPGPDEGKVEAGILGGGKVHFLGMTCAVVNPVADPSRTCSRIAKLKSATEMLAEPLPGYRFVGWTGGCAASGAKKQCLLQVDDSLVSATAVFVKNTGPMVTLTVIYGTPPMMGMRLTLKPDTELTCKSDKTATSLGIPTITCTAEFEQNSTIAIKAEDSFAGTSPINPKRWNGACKGSPTATCTLKMDQPKTVSIDYSSGG